MRLHVTRIALIGQIDHVSFGGRQLHEKEQAVFLDFTSLSSLLQHPPLPGCTLSNKDPPTTFQCTPISYYYADL